MAGGGAYAANTIGSADIIDESILSRDIRNGQVTRGDIAANAVNSSRVADGALTGADIANGALTGADVADDTLTGADVTDQTLTGADVDDDSLTGTQIDERTLDVGPLARSGRSPAGEVCRIPSAHPSTVVCASVTVTLPRPARLLLMGDSEWFGDDETPVRADCGILRAYGDDPPPDYFVPYLGAHVRPGERTDSTAFDRTQSFSVNRVTEVLPAGEHEYGLACDDLQFNAEFSNSKFLLRNSHITALALGAE